MTPEEAIQLQEQVVTGEANLFVDACPGAGKTRTVVDRFLVRSADAKRINKGVAVISFTNRAANEVSVRCAGLHRGELAGFPHFVGTFDRFIATYVVRPFGDIGGPIRIIDSWQSLDVEVAGPGGRPVSLDRFEISPDGILRFEPGPTDPQLDPTHTRIRERNASERIELLRSEGYLTCDDAREYAIRIVRNHPEVAQILKMRFLELIVDEAQDCGEAELNFLDELKNVGIPLVVVCDPNQSIYEWRDANPERFATFTKPFRPHRLTGNWRSTPAICQLAATLKDGPADHPVGQNRADPQPIHLIVYDGWPSVAIGDSFHTLLSAADISPDRAVVLAHANAAASRVAGRSHKPASNNMARIATDTALLLDPKTQPHERTRSFDRLQRLVLRYVQIDTVGNSTGRICEIHGLQPAWLREATLRVVHSVAELPAELSVDEWLVQVRLCLGSISAPEGSLSGKPGSFLRAPKKSAGKTVTEVLGPLPDMASFSNSSVHQAKGSETEAVLVVIPRDRAPGTKTADLMDAWSADLDTEARRVLYVGVTRAERLCALAVHSSSAPRVEQILNLANVPFDIHTA